VTFKVDVTGSVNGSVTSSTAVGTKLADSRAREYNKLKSIAAYAKYRSLYIVTIHAPYSYEDALGHTHSVGGQRTVERRELGWTGDISKVFTAERSRVWKDQDDSAVQSMTPSASGVSSMIYPPIIKPSSFPYRLATLDTDTQVGP
jgi:hypothetical protein